MADMTDFDAARPKPPTPKIDQIINELDAERSEALQTALNDLTYSNPTIAAVLNKWGYSYINFNTIKRCTLSFSNNFER